MFDLLKKKFSSFVNSFSEKETQKLSVSLSLESKMKSALSPEIQLTQKDVEDLLYALELSLLESDVAHATVTSMIEEIKQNLLGAKVKKSALQDEVRAIIKTTLLHHLEKEKPDLLSLVKKAEKPFRILFIGPNGAGKTTTIAKIAKLLMDNGYTCVLAASDTFRAAALEQISEHAERLNVKVIKQDYNSDPAAVCFDAIAHAKANNIDVVLMDSAGRQETNKNLLDEMRKIVRVAKPNMKIFIGESIAGNAIITQAKTFHDAIGLDGVILTKLDCDAKGGTTLSISHAIGIPILYFGTGQGYGDLKEFNAQETVEEILS